MHDDLQLLRAYADSGSEAAFRELVERRIGFVYGIAYRKVGGDAHLAQDVAEAVFCDLARKARALCQRQELSGWFFVSTRYAASDAVRRERRRRTLAHQYATMGEHPESSPERASAGLMVPVLDEALEQLRQIDRQVLLLRFYEGHTYADLGRRLGLSENAARMRVDRALEKLREALGRRGVESTGAALALALPVHAQVAAPLGLSSAIAGAAVSGTSAAAGGLLVKLMALSKLQIAAGAAALVLAAAGLTEVTLQGASNRRLEEKVVQAEAGAPDAEAVEARNAVLQAQVRDLRAAATANALHEAARNGASSGAAAVARRRTQRFHSLSEALAAAPELDAAQVDIAPAPVDQGRPAYPAAARQQAKSGTVLVDFIVGADGDVYAAHALSSSDPLFADAAVAAVSQWLFKPGLKGGAAINTHMQVPIAFTINRSSQ